MYNKESCKENDLRYLYGGKMVKIRLSRHGSKKRPYYRIIVADSRRSRDGKFIEEVGRYNPCVEPPFVKLEMEKINTWVKNGAQPTDVVAKLIEKNK